jgi:hypothetical protein
LNGNYGFAEKVFNQLFFVYGKKELGMLVLGLRPNPQLICWNKGCCEGEALESNSSIFSPSAKKSRINCKGFSEILTKTQRILDDLLKFVAFIISKISANDIYKRVFGFFSKP